MTSRKILKTENRSTGRYNDGTVRTVGENGERGRARSTADLEGTVFPLDRPPGGAQTSLMNRPINRDKADRTIKMQWNFS